MSDLAVPVEAASTTVDGAARRPRARTRPIPAALAVTVASMMAFSVVALFFGAYVYGFSAFQGQRSQHQLYAELRGLLSPSSESLPPIGGALTPGTPVALINAGAAGINNLVVVEGTSSDQLLEGPGHLRDSPLPGQVGDSILIGRGTTAGAPFGGIASLRRGDLITVTTGQGSFRFRVVDQRVPGQKLPAMTADGGLLTLVTSVGSGWLGAFTPGQLLYVDARLLGKAVTAPPGRPISVPPDEIQGHGDTSAWPFVVLWLQALLVAAVGVVWLWSRWGRLQSWLVGAPVLFAVLWGLSTEVMRLLPNVY